MHRIIKYRRLIWQVLFFTMKYHFIIKFLPNRIVIQAVLQKKDISISTKNTLGFMQPKKSLLRLTDSIIDNFILKSSCLIRSLVKRDVLIKYNYNTPISLGIAIDRGIISAHAWVEKTSGKEFTKVF